MIYYLILENLTNLSQDVNQLKIERRLQMNFITLKKIKQTNFITLTKKIIIFEENNAVLYSPYFVFVLIFQLTRSAATKTITRCKILHGPCTETKNKLIMKASIN